MKFTILITMLLGSHVNRITHILHSSHGLNLSRGHVIVDSIQVAKCEAADCGVELRAAQIFVGGPRQRIITMTPEDSQALYKFTQENHFKVFAHSAYVAAPWGGDPDAARFIRKELKVCESAGIAGLIVHLPKAPIETVIKYIPRLLNPEVGSKVRIYFETPAVRPEESYFETPEKLAALFDALRAFDADQSLFGLCVDTAHLWTCGVDISSRESAEDWLQRLEKLIPPSITIIHANDSQRPLGVGPDMHAGLADGKIWSNYALHMKASGIAAFITYADKHKLPFILERNSKEKLLNDYHIIEKLEPSVRIKAYKKCPIIGKSVDKIASKSVDKIASKSVDKIASKSVDKIASKSVNIFAGNSSKMAANFPPRTLFDHILDRKTQERVRFFITAVGKRAAASLHTTPDLLAEKVISIMEKSQLSDVEVLQRLFDLFKKVGEPPANSPANLSANLQANLPPSIHTKIKENRKKSRVSDIEVELELVKASKADNANIISYLDIGCSEGNITSAIAEYLHLTPQQANACDIMPLKIANDSFTFAQSSATALPYDSDSFDFITMFMSAHHFTDIDAMISEVYRVARNGAFLLMREHCLPADKGSSVAYYDISHAIYACTAIARPLPVENTPEEFMADYHRPGGFAQYRNLEQWTKILEKHGFIPVIEPHGPAAALAGPGRGNRMAQRGLGHDNRAVELAGPGRGNRDSSRPGPARPAARANIDSSRPGPARAGYVYDTMFDAIYMLFRVEKKEKDILDEIIEDFTAASDVKSECGCDA